MMLVKARVTKKQTLKFLGGLPGIAGASFSVGRILVAHEVQYPTAGWIQTKVVGEQKAAPPPEKLQTNERYSTDASLFQVKVAR